MNALRRALSRMAAYETPQIPTGGPYYHGAPVPRDQEISEQGGLSSAARGEQLKGTRDEHGLLWVTEDYDLAYSHAWENGQPGTVFRVEVPELLPVDRNVVLSAEQAATLDAVNMRSHYDPIDDETTLNQAMYRLLQHPSAPQTFAEILPSLGYNAIYDTSGIGVIADFLPIVEAVEPPEDSMFFKDV